MIKEILRCYLLKKALLKIFILTVFLSVLSACGSGGLQEECCVLGTPCLTLRWNTERPVTLKEHGGASVLVGNNIKRIREEYHIALKAGRVPQRSELWDGQTAMRCVQAIVNYR